MKRALCILVLASPAYADELMLSATSNGQGRVDVLSDFNGASDSVRVSALGEVNLGWRLRAAVRVLDGFSDKPRPGVGAGIQLAPGSTAYLFYKTEGFTEPEGEVEAVLAFERQLDVVRARVNVAYGQDPEGNERDGELALAAHVEPRPGWFVGATARYRDALGSTNQPRRESIVRDGFAGPTTTLALGQVAFTWSAGVAMSEQMTRSYGPATSLSLGAAF